MSAALADDSDEPSAFIFCILWYWYCTPTLLKTPDWPPQTTTTYRPTLQKLSMSLKSALSPAPLFQALVVLSSKSSSCSVSLTSISLSLYELVRKAAAVNEGVCSYAD